MPAAIASSSMRLSITNAVWVCPTDRHQRTGTADFGVCSSTRWFGVAFTYGESAAPSTEEPSTPFWIIAANGVPSMMDWHTIV